MKINSLIMAMAALATAFTAQGANDPESVVEQWSEVTSSPRIIDINFSDTSWPSTWAGETARDCPSYTDGGYVNAILDVPAVADADATVKYPVLFHHCTFANKSTYNGFGGTTAAFARQYYIGENPAGNSDATRNNWTVPGHTVYLEDNIERDGSGRPTHGEAGFVQMCRDAAAEIDGVRQSMHGWVEIDHIPYVDRLQWSWSSTSWGRGIKCDIKIGDGEWKPLVWMGSERQKQGWTVFSDQGYFMDNVIDAHDVSLRWRVWDGDSQTDPVQVGFPSSQDVDPMAQRQAPRVHKIRIYGSHITQADADFARANPVGNVGKLSDLGGLLPDNPGNTPDADADVVLYRVNPDGSADYTTIQAAIDAVPAGCRGIIHIAPGIYEENVYAGRRDNAPAFISLIGDDPATTILTSAVSRGGQSTATYNDCTALNVFCERFYAANLTIRNTSGNVGQAEALYTRGDAHVFENCIITGYQDTYKANVGARGYFRGCLISGATDFIYDGGLEWFDDCEIRAVVGGGYITAPAEASLSMTRVMYPELSATAFHAGFFFSNCRLTADDGVKAGAYSLGRPWGENSGAMYLNCRMGSHISPAGWTAWDGRESSASFFEYRSLNADGSPLATGSRASFAAQATDAEVEAYFASPDFVFGKLSDVPFDYKRITAAPAAPTDFIVDGSRVEWAADASAAGWLVYKDGAAVGFVTDPEWTKDADGAYTVAAVSRYGAVSQPVAAEPVARIKAFPTAEGFGKYATGGRGGKVVTVTSLADDGSEGTLRWAFDQHKGSPLTIVFAVSGDIALNSELRVSRADWTLAGQTAPGDGVVITRNKVNLGGSQNFIVRNMRFRIGQKNTAGQIQAENACGVENCSNFIFDHCSFGWSVEENMNTADSHFLTVQYCIVHEGLYNAGHSKGARGYGCQWGGSPATYHHNLLANNVSRSCRFNGARGDDYVVFMEYVNNVNYNYGGTGGCYGGENTADINSYNGLNSAHECNFINNYYRAGAASNSLSSGIFVNSSYARDGAKSWAPAKWYINGNAVRNNATVTADNWKGVTAEGYTLDRIKADERIVTATPWWRHTPAGVYGRYVPADYMLDITETADEAYASVVAKAGCVRRDRVETRVAAEARDGVSNYGGKTKGSKSGIIDTEADAEGFFTWPADFERPTDTDGDGMPDAWETANGLDPVTADNNRLNRDGYTALEVYLASLMGETLSADFSQSGIGDISLVSAEIVYDRATDALIADIDATAEIYSTDGRLLGIRAFEGGRLSLGSFERGGVLLVSVSAPGLAPRVVKVAR